MGKKLFNNDHSKCLRYDPKSTHKSKKINKWNIKVKSFSHSKRSNKMKKQATEWEKIFANHISDKMLISKTYKELLQLDTKKRKNPKNGQN